MLFKTVFNFFIALVQTGTKTSTFAWWELELAGKYLGEICTGRKVHAGKINWQDFELAGNFLVGIRLAGFCLAGFCLAGFFLAGFFLVGL